MPGAPRLTEGVDVTVEVPSGGAKAILRALAKHGVRKGSWLARVCVDSED